MDSQPQHARLITMLPQHAAVPVFPPLRAGEKQEVDFEVLSAAALLNGIILRRCDDSISAIPGALGVLLGPGDSFSASCTRGCAQHFVPMRWRRTRAPDVRRGGCPVGCHAGVFGHGIVVHS